MDNRASTTYGGCRSAAREVMRLGLLRRSVEWRPSPPLPTTIRAGRDENENGCQRAVQDNRHTSGAVPHRTQTAADRNQAVKDGNRPAPAEAPERNVVSLQRLSRHLAQTQARESSSNEHRAHQASRRILNEATRSPRATPQSPSLKREHHRETTELQKIAHETIWTTAGANARAN